ncbi:MULTISPECIES: PP2C family protein-serine/threonine phosphatase [unclassified Streptomyces]|uniref:PP2C family protein-serine/threonine phosphatase n=1 Tax=unclassified Streptomyces TaxID=2593676 RepID=UPI000BF843B7|nr:GAF domain-containing SpoIIE family protein phosphatase [Streptomyces sp. Ru87]PGH51118.1 hypothetical protein CRI70_08290 [Streptomyces sp. Ru87]
MDGAERAPGEPSGKPEPRSLLHLPLGEDLDRISEQLHSLARAQKRLQSLLEAVMSIGSELELPTVLRRIVSTAMELVDARYGAMGVLEERGELLAEFIPLGLSSQELSDLSGIELPRGRGLLGHLIRHPDPMRVQDISHHPGSAGFPPGHPPMRSLLGVAIGVRGRIYGNLYLTERRDGQPFDEHDESVVVALAGAAGIAIENARLYEQVRNSAEQFQRLLLPRLPDLHPFDSAAVYRPASAPGHLGGDWYDALTLSDGSCVAVIGDVVGHDMPAAAAMAQTRSMLRAMVYDLRTPPSAILDQLDHLLLSINENPLTTLCLARIEPDDQSWNLHWSSAGHPPPLVVPPHRPAHYLGTDPGLPLGVEPGLPRPDHIHRLLPETTVLLFTDGLVEHPERSLDEGLLAVAETATRHAGASLDDLCDALMEHHPGDGHDDIAVLALRTPAPQAYGQR